MAEPRYIGSDKQLLLDADLVSRSDAVTLRVHPLRTAGELVVAPDQPWETLDDAYIAHVDSVMHDGGRFRLWYDYIYRPRHAEQPGANGRCMAYAESADGIHFDKPPTRT